MINFFILQIKEGNSIKKRSSSIIQKILVYSTICLNFFLNIILEFNEKSFNSKETPITREITKVRLDFLFYIF